MKRIHFAIAAALLLGNGGGCFGGGDRPVTQVPVRQGCIDQSDLPPETPPLGRLPDDARQALPEAAAKILELRGEVSILRALLGPCIRR